VSRQWKTYGILVVLCLLAGCHTAPLQERAARNLNQALSVIESSPGDSKQSRRANASYLRALANVLPGLMKSSSSASFALVDPPARGDFSAATFVKIAPVRHSRISTPGLHRAGLGLPAVGTTLASPNSPRSGYRIALTAVALPQKLSADSFGVRLADPERVTSVHLAERPVPVAMDLEAALDATRATGPRLLDGFGFLLRPDRKQSRLIFLQPYDPGKIPVVLIHGLTSTPGMWAPVVKTLLANAEIRRRYQFWFFYYPTGQPVPLSALQLREALDEAVLAHKVRQPMILVGHSMGGILARAQVSRLSPAEAEEIFPTVSQLPASSTLRRCLIFEPRKDVSRVVFICTPHRGSRLALGSLGRLAIGLIRLPGWIVDEMAEFASQGLLERPTRLPTSIQGLSPYSRFLTALGRTLPTSPSHSIIGKRDGIVPFSSSHFEAAQSETLVPTGHGGFAHPQTLQEVRRILTSF
jgi:pimeloyl-ACP methyl ester carboxylesterase